jgi:serine/threonine protein kinase
MAIAHACAPFWVLLPFTIAALGLWISQAGVFTADMLVALVVISFSFSHPPSQTLSSPSVRPGFEVNTVEAKREIETAQRVVEERRPGAGARLAGHVVSFAEVHVQERVGAGAFGDVFRGSYQTQPVACKFVHKHRVTKDAISALLSEVDIMVQCKHPNIVSLVGVTLDPLVCVLLEFASFGTVRQYLHKFPANSWSHAKTRMAVDAAAGLAYLHGRGLVHGDVKTENLLVCEGGAVKVADFGSARQQQHSSPLSVVGSSMWLAPEVARGLPASEKSDVWAFGVCLCEMVTQQQPYSRPGQSTNYFRLVDVAQMTISPLAALEGIPAIKGICDVIEPCVAFDVSARSDIRHVLFALLQLFVAGDAGPEALMTPAKAVLRRPAAAAAVRVAADLAQLESPEVSGSKRISDPTMSTSTRKPLASDRLSPLSMV